MFMYIIDTVYTDEEHCKIPICMHNFLVCICISVYCSANTVIFNVEHVSLLLSFCFLCF